MADSIFKSAATEDNATGRLGRTLQYEREKQGLSVEDIAQQLCLSVVTIRDLEAGNDEKLPGLVYVRGYVRAYCKVLKIDPEPLLEDYVFNLQEHQDDDAMPSMDEHVYHLTRLWGSLAVFTVVVLLVAMWWMDQSRGFRGLPPPVSVSPPAPIPTPKATWPVVPPLEPQPFPASESQPSTSPLDEESSEFVSSPPQDSPILDGNLIEITIHAMGSSWAYVADGSGEMINRMLSAGYQKVIYGVFPLEFKFGDARNMRLWVNGEEYDVSQHISQLNTAFFKIEQPIQ